MSIVQLSCLLVEKSGYTPPQTTIDVEIPPFADHFSTETIWSFHIYVTLPHAIGFSKKTLPLYIIGMPSQND